MRRRICIVLLLNVIISMKLFAYSFGITPWQGGFGLNMASGQYDFRQDYEIEYSSGSEDNDGDRTQYSDAEMIAVAGVYDIDRYDEYDQNGMQITASCEGGFYFTSRSNPDAKRPFEIKLVLHRTSHTSTIIGFLTPDSDRSEWLTLGKSNGGEQGYASINYPYSGASWSKPLVSNGYRYRYIWCDIVISLPFESVSSTGVLRTPDGGTYNLVEADDYNAVVTISISFNGNTKSITIPLSGYFSRNNTKPDSTASLDIRTLPAAMNLNIGGTRRMERVAEVDFMANLTEYDPGILGTSTSPIDNAPTYFIFLSASNDASNPEDRGFELVHSSVKYTDPHTPYNSIGYTARLVSEDPQTGAVLGYKDFDGTDFVDGLSMPGIELELVENNASYQTGYYSEFHGAVEVLIDEVSATGDQEGINKMLSGQYTSTIYVHVVGE